MSLLARLYTGVDSTSCQVERNLSVFNRTVDDPFLGMAVERVEHLLLLRLNTHTIPDIASLREVEAEINTHTQGRRKAVSNKVNTREAAATGTAPGAVGASHSSSPQSIEDMGLS